MTPNFPLLSLEAQVQNVLNEMSEEKLLPFTLNVGKITKGPYNYTLFFYDSRMRSTKVPLSSGPMLGQAVRASVLAKVDKLSGPLRMPRGISKELTLAGHLVAAIK